MTLKSRGPIPFLALAALALYMNLKLVEGSFRHYGLMRHIGGLGLNPKP